MDYISRETDGKHKQNHQTLREVLWISSVFIDRSQPRCACVVPERYFVFIVAAQAQEKAQENGKNFDACACAEVVFRMK